MQEALGVPGPDVAAALNPLESQEAFRLIGAQIASDRVLIDTARIFAIAFVFWRKATPEQRKKIKGFSQELLAFAVDRAIALEAMKREFTQAGTADKGARLGSTASAGVAFQKGLTLRDQADVALQTAVGTDAGLRKRLKVALGIAEDGEQLASGLARLSAFGVELLANPKTKVRATLAGIDADYLTELTTEAAAVRAATKDASGRLTANTTSQGELDTLDGLNIDLLSHIVHAFAAARERDGTIPRLVPLSTRRLLSSRTKPKPAVSPPAPDAGPVPEA